MRDLIRVATRDRHRVIALLVGGVLASIVAAALIVAFGIAGAVVVLAAGQVVTLALLVQSRAALGRASRQRYRANQRRLERDLRQRDRRIAALERRAELVVERLLHDELQRGEKLADDGRHAQAAGVFGEALVLSPSDGSLRSKHLEQLRAGGHEGAESRFVAATAEQGESGNLDHAAALAREGLTLAPASGRLRDLLVAVLDASGDPDRALEVAVEGAHAHVAELRRRRGHVEVVRRLAPHQRVFISGFFYSGSGAVLDHLIGFPGVKRWPRGEMRLIKFPGGLDDIGKRFMANGVLEAQDLVDLYLHLTGSKLRFGREDSYDKWDAVNVMGRRMFEEDLDNSAGFLSVILQGFVDLVTAVQAGTLTVAGYEEHLRQVLTEAFDAAATDTQVDHLVVDQAVTAWRLDISRFLPPSSFVMVHRDPRDQFAEAREVLQKPGRSKRKAEPEGFVRVYRRNRERADEQVPELEERFGHRFLRLSFEDFVVEHSRIDAELRRFLDLGDREPARRRFRPERSIVNVGKHRALLDDVALEVLRAELGEYFSKHADEVASADDVETPVDGTALGWERASS